MNVRIQNERREAAISRNVRKLEWATRGLDVTPEERRTLLWLAEWESGSVANVAALLEKARRGGGA